MKNIIITGFPRSGSTLLYNLTRITLIEAGLDVYGCWHDDFNSKKAKQINIIKIHTFSPKWLLEANLILMSIRNLTDISKSLNRMEWSLDNLDQDIENQFQWVKSANQLFSFNEIVNHSETVIKYINSKFNINTSVETVLEKIKEIKPPINQLKYDPITLLHPKHF